MQASELKAQQAEEHKKLESMLEKMAVQNLKVLQEHLGASRAPTPAPAAAAAEGRMDMPADTLDADKDDDVTVDESAHTALIKWIGISDVSKGARDAMALAQAKVPLEEWWLHIFTCKRLPTWKVFLGGKGVDTDIIEAISNKHDLLTELRPLMMEVINADPTVLAIGRTPDPAPQPVNRLHVLPTALHDARVQHGYPILIS
eukprot:3139463-Karenia_brevis.AAC.1